MTFTSRLSDDADGYAEAAERMVRLAAAQPGFLGMEHRREPDGLGVTVCYWDSMAAIEGWRDHPEHRAAKAEGKARWYARWEVRIERIGPSR